ncbi:MAG: hypothetical protein PVF29_17305 [Desulfobacterales bacterium]|jgi:hypothetical protein
MHNTTQMVGMGCFAKSQSLQQRFRKVLENFPWLRYEDLYPATEGMFNNENVRRFFGSVIRSGTERPDQIDRALEVVSAATQITGFYLGMDKQSLHLIVFLRDVNWQSTNLTIRLEKFSRLKEIRLH